jgi:hypothetical protein
MTYLTMLSKHAGTKSLFLLCCGEATTCISHRQCIAEYLDKLSIIQYIKENFDIFFRRYFNHVVGFTAATVVADDVAPPMTNLVTSHIFRPWSITDAIERSFTWELLEHSPIIHFSTRCPEGEIYASEEVQGGSRVWGISPPIEWNHPSCRSTGLLTKGVRGVYDKNERSKNKA